jgi:hypothetical protein
MHNRQTIVGIPTRRPQLVAPHDALIGVYFPHTTG